MAADFGHEELLQWARANGCPWDGAWDEEDSGGNSDGSDEDSNRDGKEDDDCDEGKEDPTKN
jgi:hypothetical protein